MLAAIMIILCVPVSVANVAVGCVFGSEVRSDEMLRCTANAHRPIDAGAIGATCASIDSGWCSRSHDTTKEADPECMRPHWAVPKCTSV